MHLHSAAVTQCSLMRGGGGGAQLQAEGKGAPAITLVVKGQDGASLHICLGLP